tara:strand:- start:11474 stop:12058 length:585 start_codon:yes stop_codon:yes gene_type:complete
MSRREILKLTDVNINAINDSLIGGVGTPSGNSRYAGQLGVRFPLQADELQFDSSVGDVFTGVFQYVRTLAGQTVTKQRIAFWSDPENFVVTPTNPSPEGRVAGVYLNAPTAGNYTVIQVGGLVDLTCIASITKTGAAGDLCLVDTTDGRVDNIADATGLTSLLLRRVVGEFHQVPANNGVVQVLLRDNLALPGA